MTLALAAGVYCAGVYCSAVGLSLLLIPMRVPVCMPTCLQVLALAGPQKNICYLST